MTGFGFLRIRLGLEDGIEGFLKRSVDLEDSAAV